MNGAGKKMKNYQDNWMKILRHLKITEMKNLVILLIIILSSFRAQSQTSSDSTKLANADIKVLLKIGDDWKRLSEEVILLNDRNVILYEKIFLRDSVITTQANSLSKYESVIAGHQRSEANLIAQRKNLELALKKMTRKAKWNNTKSFIGGAGIVIVGALYLLK